MPDVHHNASAQRFVADVEGGEAELTYTRQKGEITFKHTFVPVASRGQNVATTLVEAGLAHARSEGLDVVPACPFVKAYMQEHAETQDLLA